MPRTRTLMMAALCLGALPAALTPAAQAQAAADATGEIVVTADPLRRPAPDIARAVTTLDQEALLAAPVTAGLGEALDGVPGVASTFFGAGASRPVIRGLGEDRIRILSEGLGQIDVSAISPDHAVPSEGLEARGVEIIRGPAALAFGGNAIGGVVNVLDYRIAETQPEKAFSIEGLAATAAGTEASELAAGARWALGPVVLRLEGFSRDAGDYEIPGFALSAGARAAALDAGASPAEFVRDAAPNSFAEAQSGAFGASYVADWGFIGASIKRVEQLYGIASAEEPEPGDPLPGPRIDLEQTRYDLRFGWTRPIGPFTEVRLSLGGADYTHTEIEPSAEPGTVFDNDGFEARLTATHTLFGGQGVIGASGFRTDIAAVGEEAFISPTVTEDVGVFAVQSFTFGRFGVEGGARYERRELDNAVNGGRSFDLVSASLGGSVRPADGVFFGATLTYTERAPTETELFADGPHLATAAFEVGDPALDVESAVSVEAVGRLAFGRLQLEGALYWIEFNDFIGLFATGAEEDELPVFQFAAADASFRGGELSARYALIERDGLQLAADFSLEAVQGELDAGGYLPRIPPRSFTVGLEGAAGPFGGRVEWVDVASADDLAALETPTEGFGLLNLRLDWRGELNGGRVVLALDGRNLADEEARVHSAFTKDLAPRPGRTVRLSLRAAF